MSGAAQRGQEGVGDRDDAEFVRFVGAAEAIDVRIGSCPAVDHDTGVVDQDIQGLDSRSGVGDRRGIGDVHYEQASLSADFLHCALAALNRARTNIDGEPRGREPPRDLFADAGICARDKRCAIGHGNRDAHQPTAQPTITRPVDR